jgi:hypothetical protein
MKELIISPIDFNKTIFSKIQQFPRNEIYEFLNCLGPATRTMIIPLKIGD